MTMFRIVLAACSFAALATGALAQGTVLTGKDAFGDWSKDAPGVTRHITIDDLDKPNATPDSSNAPGLVDRPDGAMPKVPDGFKVEVFATGLKNPRAMRFAPNGDLFVADSESDRVLVFHTADTSGKAEPTIFAKGLHQPYGINFYPATDPQWVYVANSNSVVRFPYKAGETQAEGKPETVVADIPDNHHWTRDIVFSPDGKTMYLSVGSGSNVAEGIGKEPPGGLEAWAKDHALGDSWGSEEGRADVWSMTPDGKDKKIFATGLRNCAGMTVQPGTDKVWCVVNERDDLGDNVPFEYATHVQAGAYYGWPWYYLGNHEDPRHAAVRPDLAGKATVPDVLMQAHSAPLNIAFYEGDGFGADFKGSAFVAMHGSWNRGERTGYKVVLLKFKDGTPTGEYQDFMTGFVIDKDNVWGRPVGLAVAQDGSLYVSDDGSGTIWRVSKQ